MKRMSGTVAAMVYEALLLDPALDSLLARSVLPPGTAPAIYDRWAAPGTPLPYIVLSWSYSPGDHWAKRVAALTVDVFAQGPSAGRAGAIRDRIVVLLDRRLLTATEAGPVRCYVDNDGIAPEDDPQVVHWVVQFSVVFWRCQFVAQLVG